VLLLDEPTAGVAQRDAEAFGPLLRQLRDELDCAIVIVEHDMPLLMGLCDRVYALVLGAVIASGTPTEVLEHPRVIESYLGTNEADINRAGAQGKSPEAAPAPEPVAEPEPTVQVAPVRRRSRRRTEAES
jgi:ABC-type Mn2+/Zn2+ transport system ATPase subunit